MGGALEQFVNEVWHPLAFFSRKFNKAQSNYSTFDRELTAIVESVKYFLYYLEGRKFTVITDHKPIIYAQALSHDKAPARRVRQLIFLAQFDIAYEYQPGKNNDVADAFSRIELSAGEVPSINSISLDSIEIPSNFTLQSLRDAQQSDTELTKILSDADISLKLASFPFGPQKIELYGERRGERIRPFLPASLRDEVFDVLHASAHPSARAMKSLIKARYVWPDMDRDITRRCSACIRCQAAKVGRHTKPTPCAPSSRFHHVHIDIVGPLPVCRGYRYLLTMIDRFTRWPKAVPLRDITAETVAREFHNCWIARFGSPRIITSDQGSQFESRLFRELLAVLGIKRCRTTSFHPSANGLIERWHRTLKAALMCHAHPENWLELLPSVLLGLRTRLVGEFDVSPAEMLYGTTLAIPGDLCFNTHARVDPKIFASKFRAHMNEVRPVPVKHKSKITPFVAKELPFCTHVFKLVKKSKPPLQPPYTGPHKIINRDAAHNTYTIDFYGREQVVSVDKLKPAHLLPETASPGIGREKFVPAILRRNRVVKGV
uniref:RNA-directed DNA polymerase n=1 Tax=Trichogramma kaykai TaxID=54128 RepID=A0ABD2WIL2_9HYME